MNARQAFFHLLEGKQGVPPLFFPDISTWYENTRKPFGAEELFAPGAYIENGHPFHGRPSRLEGPHSLFRYTDYYREYGWGLPAHMYDWLHTRYTGNITTQSIRDKGYKRTTYATPHGPLYRTYRLDHDGSWAPADTLLKDWDKDLPALKYLLEHAQYSTDFSGVETFLRETEGFGVCDIVIHRSPFGKLVHEYLGFEQTIYALEDYGDEVLEFLRYLEAHDLEIIRLAAKAPCKLVILSDHADENLISPLQYRDHCIPYYRKACAILHKAGKVVSTHLDGNIKGYLPLLGKTGFDLLDGCTPAPMFNYTPEELAAAPGRPACYLGIPATLFVDDTPAEEVCRFAGCILDAFGGQVVVNVGDILPPGGDIEKVIAAGQAVQAFRG